MAKTFGVRPSTLLYPAGKDANFAFSLDNYIFDIGFEKDMEIETQLEQAKIKFHTELAKRGINRA